MKKIGIVLGCTAGAVIIGAGVWFGIRQMNQTEIKVFAVSDMSQGYWGNDMMLNGMISSDVSQEVHLTDKQVVQEVFVKEGDQVEVGTPLLSYDMTLVDIELEMEKLNKEGLAIQKKGLEQEIQKIKDARTVTKEQSQNGTNPQPPSQKQTKSTAEANHTPATANTGVPNEPSEVSQSTGDQSDENSGLEDLDWGDMPFEDGDFLDGDFSDSQETESGNSISGNQEPSDAPNSHPSPDVNEIMEAYKILDEKSVPYQGKGTKENPYVYLCQPNPTLMGSFLNKIGGFDEKGQKSLTQYYCMLEVREENKTEGLLMSALRLDGRTIVDKSNPTEGFQIQLGEDREALENGGLLDNPENPDGAGEEDGEFFDIGEVVPEEEIIEGYTKEEKEKLIEKKQQEIKNMELNIKQSDLKIKEISKKLEDQTINSTIKGTVKSVGDPNKGEVDGKPFIEVVSSEGLYVQGSISELLLNDVKVGQLLMGNSYESGISFQAEIKEISQYPAAGNNFGGMGNANASYYPFTAFIENGEGLRNQEYVDLQLNIQNDQDMNALFLPKPFIREEDGKTYVYKRDENQKLVKQDIVTGKTMYGSVTEVKSGITTEDMLAFPYGKGVKEGAKTKEGTMEELYS